MPKIQAEKLRELGRALLVANGVPEIGGGDRRPPRGQRQPGRP